MINLKVFLFVAMISLIAVFVPAAQNEPPRDKTDIVLVMGQSNASGRGWPYDPEDSIGSSQVWRWCLDGSIRSSIGEPFGNDVGYVAVGPGLAFGKEWVNLYPDRHIIVVFASQGNTMLSDWKKGSFYYNRALSRIRPTLTSGTLIGVIWHHGEGDSIYQNEADTYGERLATMIRDFRSDLGQNVPFVCGGLGDFLTTTTFPYRNIVNEALSDVDSYVPKASFVSADGLKDTGDSTHFTATSQKILGTRYADALSTMQSSAVQDWNKYQ